MGKIYLAIGEHIHQPPLQISDMMYQIYLESYDPKLKLTETRENVRFSLDITRSAGEMLPRKYLKRLKECYERGRILEMVRTPEYHPILPLLPDNVARDQINGNDAFYQEAFGIDRPSPILFHPELAIDPKQFSLFRELGIKGIIADDKPWAWARRKEGKSKHEETPLNWIPVVNGCAILLRSRMWSNYASFGIYPNGYDYARALIAGQQEWRRQCGITGDSYVALYRDWETDGHHHKNALGNFSIPFYETIASMKDICEIMPFTFLYEHFEKREITREEFPEGFPAGSWVAETTDLNEEIPYPFWAHPRHAFHVHWKAYLNTVYHIVSELDRASLSPELCILLRQMPCSCWPWWSTKNDAAARNFARRGLLTFERIINLLPEHPKRLELFRLIHQMHVSL